MSGRAPAGAAAVPKFELLTPEDIAALPDLEWLIEGVLPKPGLVVLYGEPGSFKTFVALDMALTVASGREWLGRVTLQTKALYIAAEGVRGFKLRVAAHAHRRGLTPENIRFIAEVPLIMDPAHIRALLASFEKDDFEPGLIVVDTLARVALGADENNAKDMGRVVDGLDELKRQTGATVMVIHHTRKDGGSERGSSALRGAADAMILCEKVPSLDGAGVRLECAKMKDDEPFADIGATLEKVALPGGKSSLIVGDVFDILRATGQHADKIVEILTANFAESGATHGELKNAFVAETGNSASTFNRAWRGLKETDRVRIETVDGRTRIYPATKD